MFRKISNFVGATTPSPTSHAGRATSERETANKLLSYGIPTSLEDCSTCDDPCDEDGENGENGTAGRIDEIFGPYEKGFDVDWDSELLGSANPAPRSLIVSTGKSDWPHDHVEDKTTLSHHLARAIEGPLKPVPAAAPGGKADKGKGGGGKFVQKPVFPEDGGLPLGISNTPLPAAHTPSSLDSSLSAVPSAPSPKTSLFSSSLVSQSNDHDKESVLVFPDWKVVTEVENSAKGAEEVWKRVNGEIGESDAEEGVQKRTWTLPYRAVVLLCSHKRRDKRCHIAAPLLETALVHELEAHHVSVDLKGELLSEHHLEDSHPALEEIPVAEREVELEKRLRAIPDVDDEEGGGEVGIFRINHLGGHRYAGVMIILFPSGATLYYGRVSPQEIKAVVNETILKGNIVAGLLRGANNVVRAEAPADKGCLKGKTLLQW